MNRKYILPVMAMALLGVTTVGVLGTRAQEGTGETPSLVHKIAERFGLKESDVQAVFDETREEHRAQMQARFEEVLNQAVADGQLTEAQKKLILDKKNELRTEHEANHDALKNMTPEERRSAMQARRSELEAWAKENGIDIKYLFGAFTKGPGHDRVIML